MGRKGDLLELLDGAPLGVTSLTGSVWKWTHRERSQQAFTALADSGGGSVSHLRMQVQGPARDTDDQHFRLWVAFPDRWRIQSDDLIDVRHGGTRWIGSSTQVTQLDHDRSGLEATPIGLLVASGSRLLGALRFGESTDDMVAGRPSLRVDATLSRSPGTRHPSPIEFQLGGMDHSFWFDRATGIVLRRVARFEDEPFALEEFKDLQVNPTVTDRDVEFVAPVGGRVERQVDKLIRLAEDRGIDLSRVDREDARALQAALHAVLRPTPPTPAVRFDLQKAKHVPMGDPPDDEAAARSSIEYAFTHHDEVDDSGTALINVQSGKGLAGPLREAQRRVPASAEGHSGIVVDDIHFLRSDQAVVWFSVEVDGQRFAMVNGREGRAVKVGDRWMIEHATIVDLLGFAGVVVPPPS